MYTYRHRHKPPELAGKMLAADSMAIATASTHRRVNSTRYSSCFIEAGTCNAKVTLCFFATGMLSRSERVSLGLFRSIEPGHNRKHATMVWCMKVFNYVKICLGKV